VATGIGIARNALVARSALCLVAVGGGTAPFPRTPSACSSKSGSSAWPTLPWYLAWRPAGHLARPRWVSHVRCSACLC